MGAAVRREAERPPGIESPAPLAGGNRDNSKQSRGNDDNNEPGGQPQGAFAAAAEEYWRRGFAPLPLGGLKGNEPRVSAFTKWAKKPPIEKIREWAQLHPAANIGIVTGPVWGVTIVDVDDPQILDAVIARFGELPIRVSTPRGGTHLWYRSSGESCVNLRPEGLDADVKGRGGIIVCPPSVRPSGEFAGRRYELVAGCDWASLKDLPTIKPGALAPAAVVTPLRAVAQGRRNKTLLQLLLPQAKHCDDLETLIDVARTIVASQFEISADNPFTEAEVLKVARQAWRYETSGNNWAGREPSLIVPASVLELDADSGWLFMVLRGKHWEHQRFAMSPEGMAAANLIPGWGKQRYRCARQTLLDRGYLVLVHQGGSKLGDPSLFTFGKVARHTLQ